MAYTYLFDHIAAKEYEDAFKWYEKESTVAADNFILAVKSALAAICKEPLRYRNSYKNLHELLLRKYPYHVVYYIDESKKLVIIVSLYHQKRNPKGKYKS
jgi:plasmid stabilization system protein ParE